MSSPSREKSSQGTLSRNSLYTTLTNDISNGNVENDQLKLGFQSSTSNRKEKALFEFLERVSMIHHQPLHHGNNNQKHTRNKGSNHVSASRIETALSRRALTLYGGGIHNSLAPSTISMVTNTNTANDNNQNLSSSHLNKKKERTKKRNFQKLSLYNQPVYGSISNRQRKKMMKEKKTMESTNITSKVETSVLFSLHQMWNDYFIQLLNHSGNNCFHRCDKDCNEEDTTTQQQPTIIFHNDQISRLVSNAELVGAFVRIDQCKSCRNYTGKNGLILQMTKNTWKIASYNNNNAKSLIHKVWTVPKKGTILTLRVSVDTSNTNNKGPFINRSSADTFYKNENDNFLTHDQVLVVSIEQKSVDDA